MHQSRSLGRRLGPAAAVFVVALFELVVTDGNILALAGSLFLVGLIVGRVRPSAWVSAMVSLALAGALFGLITSFVHPIRGVQSLEGTTVVVIEGFALFTPGFLLGSAAHPSVSGRAGDEEPESAATAYGSAPGTPGTHLVGSPGVLSAASRITTAIVILIVVALVVIWFIWSLAGSIGY